MRLGVDVGSVRVGVAASDPSGLLATPVRTVPRDPDVEAALPGDLAELAALVAERGGRRGRGRAAADTRRHRRCRRAHRAHVCWAAGGAASPPCPFVSSTSDSRRSTRTATSVRAGSTVGEQRAVVDQAAAVLILQAALDAERSSGRPPGELVRTGGRKPRTKDRHR